MEFADTNVLLYASLPDPEDQEKAARASALLQAHDVGLSTQVLQEFYTQLTRATRPHRRTPEEALELLETFLGYTIQPITTDLVRAAIATHQRFQISYWDAAIIEAARSLGCGVVLSEDLNDGQDYDGVRIENPFRPQPS